MTFAPGANFEPYEIIASLGAGGMGEVYRALDPRLGREVAIKVLPTDFAGDPERLRRFEVEARTISSLNHPNVLTIYDIGIREGAPFLVFELLEGETLREKLGAGPLPRSKALDLGVQLYRGLAAAHRVGVVHRDLKPENLFVTSDGRLKILDFGLAKLVGIDDVEPGNTDDDLTLAASDATQVGAVLGTVGYMAPEQVRGEAVDQRADIFAAGAVLHEVLSGHRVFRAPTRPETLTAILRSDPQESIPDPVLDRVVRRCLEKRPEERFQSADDVAFALEALSGTALSRVAPTEAPGDAPPSPSKMGVRPAHWALVALLVAGVALVTILWPHGSSTSEGDRRAGETAVGDLESASSSETRVTPSVVVLPLSNLSGDAAQEYFADGMTESLIIDLSHLSGLRVISRTSAMRYKGTDKPLPQIAEELGVQYILAGSALQIGERVRISIELVDVATEEPLWSERFDRDFGEVLALQSEVSGAIAQATQLRLTPSDERRLETKGRVDPRVHELYLRARYLWHTRDPDAVRESLNLFEQTIEIDPEYAEGHLGVALASLVLSAHTGDDNSALYSRAARSAEHALALDPDLPEGHLILAELALHRERNWSRAEAEYLRAIELNPGDSTAHYWYAELLVARGQFAEALREVDLALAIDPLSSVANLYRGNVLSHLGRDDEALRQLEVAGQKLPDVYFIPLTKGLLLAHLGRCTEGIAATDRARQMAPQTPRTIPGLAEAVGVCGDVERAKSLLEPLEQTGALGHYEFVGRAAVYANIGDHERAFELLWEAIANDNSDLYSVANERRFMGLRDDPRFAEVVTELGLPIVPLPPFPG